MSSSRSPERPILPDEVRDLIESPPFCESDALGKQCLMTQILEASLDGICFTDEDTELIVACNSAMVELVERTRADLVGSLRSTLFHSTNPDAGTTGHIVERRVATSSGDAKDVEVKATNLVMRGRRVTLEEFRDITTRKRTEEALTKSNDRYAKLIDQVPGALYQFERTPDGRVRLPFASPQFAKSFGVPPQDVLENADAIFQAILPEDLPAILASIDASASAMGVWSHEFRVTIPGEGVQWRHAHSFPEQLPDGGVMWHGFVTDITERKLVEETLRKSEEALRQTFELSPVSIATVGLDRRLVLSNHAFARFLGYEEEEMRDKTIDEITHPEDRHIGKGEMMAMMRGEIERATVEKRYVRKDGEIVWGEVSISLIRDRQGVPLHFLPVIQDVTKRKNAERDLELAWDKTLEGWVTALDMRDNETKGHSERVMSMAIELGTALGISGQELIALKRGALLHDIGKMAIPDHILKSQKVFRKDDSMTQEEAEQWAEMQSHTLRGYHMIREISYLEGSLDIPLRHHERWDGSGYPGHIDLSTGKPLPGCTDARGNAHGLAGEEIPLVARIFAVCDVWDGLRSTRPYRKAWTKEQVIEHLISRRGTHLDARIVDLFLKSRAYEEVDAMRDAALAAALAAAQHPPVG